MSRFDRVIDRIAFGAARRAGGPCLGLYLSPEVIYLSESRLDKDGRLIVEHLVRIPLATDAKGSAGTATMSSDFLGDPLKVAGVIRQSMSQLRWRSKRVRVTLSHSLGLLRYFAMPDMEPRFLRTAVPLEAKKYIPISFDALAYDFQVSPLSADTHGRGRIGILITVAQKKTLADIKGLLDVLGLTLDGIEVAPCSMVRLWQAIDPPKGREPFAHVHIDAGGVRIMIFDRGMPVFFREVFLGAEVSADDQKKIDLSGCLSFVQKHLGVDGFSLIRVSGSSAKLEEIRAAFAQECGVPAVIQDAPRLLAVKSGDWGGYASLGASALPHVSTPVALDLAETGRVTYEERRTARDMLIAAAIFSLFFAGMGISKSMTYKHRAKELRRYGVEPGLTATFSGLKEADIEKRLADMRAQLDVLRMLTSDARPKISVVLKEVVDAMPEKIWLESISVGSPVGTDAKVQLIITLKGHAQGTDRAEEQTMAFLFRDQLLAAPLAGKIFDIQAEVGKGQGSGLDQGFGLDPTSLAARLEDRTIFSVIMRQKR